MKRRLQFVSNSSSSSFIGIITNDTNYPIEVKDWICEKIDKLIPHFIYDDGDNDIISTVRGDFVYFDTDLGESEFLEPGNEYLLRIEIMQRRLDLVTVYNINTLKKLTVTDLYSEKEKDLYL